MNIHRFKEYDGHEALNIYRDPKSGLVAIIALHNTNLGPAAGATRFAEYKSEADAIRDALRLARGMTYKAALADVPFGGGKAVIMKTRPKDRDLLHTYGRIVQSLNGLFYTGQDVGMTADDVKLMAEATEFVIGKLPESNDPPYWTALGVVSAMRAAMKAVYGSDKFKNRTVAIKGVGNVGGAVARMLHAHGAKLIIADADAGLAQKLAADLPGTEKLSPTKILFAECDILSPCAMSRDLSPSAIRKLRCKIVCGGANNQLSSPESGILLHRRKILYVPDYVANAGGMINVLAELDTGGYSRQRVEHKVLNIRNTVAKIIRDSRRTRRPTNVVADEMARRKFERKK